MGRVAVFRKKETALLSNDTNVPPPSHWPSCAITPSAKSAACTF